MKLCTLGKRHSWKFSHNRTVVTGWGKYRTISNRGVYRCDCGETKLGRPGDAQ